MRLPAARPRSRAASAARSAPGRRPGLEPPLAQNRIVLCWTPQLGIHPGCYKSHRPIATRPQFEKILSYIRIAKDEGARCVLGGRARPDLGAGMFIEPTIF